MVIQRGGVVRLSKGAVQHASNWQLLSAGNIWTCQSSPPPSSPTALSVSPPHHNPLLSSSTLVKLKMNKRVIYVHQGTKGDLLSEVIALSQPFT